VADFFDFSIPSSPGWSNGGGDPPFAFTRTDDGTPSTSTGPLSGVNSSGYYYFAETSSPRSTGDIFKLAYDGSACTSMGGQVARVSFYYHARGSSMGVLRLVDAVGSAAWTRSGPQGDAWLFANAEVDSQSFAFQYTRGSSYTGDMGIARVEVTCGMLPPKLPPMLPSPNLPPSTPPPPPSPPIAPGTHIVHSITEVRAKIENATGSGSALMLWLPPGTTIVLDGSPIEVRAFNLTLSSGFDGAVIDGEGHSLLFHVYSGATLEVNSMTLKSGRQHRYAKAGGILTSGFVSLRQSSIINCTILPGASSVSWMAGGIRVDGGSVTLRESSVSECTADSVSRVAGGVLITAGIVLLEDSSILSCSTAYTPGGGNWHAGGIVVYGGSLLFLRSALSNCSATIHTGDWSAGGIVVDGDSSSIVLFTASKIFGCSSSAAGGFNAGGIFLVRSSVALEGSSVDACTASYNSWSHNSQYLGGGICVLDGLLTLRSSSINSCDATSIRYDTAGGICVMGGSIELKSSSIVGCIASYLSDGGFGVAGGMYTSGGSTTLDRSSIVNCTSWSYEGGLAGGIFLNDGEVKLQESIISGCVATTDWSGVIGAMFITGGAATLDASMIADCMGVASRTNGLAIAGILSYGVSPRISATKLVLRPSVQACTQPLLFTDGTHADYQWQIRDLHVEMPSACANSSLHDMLAGVRLPQCAVSGTIQQANGVSVPMCGRGALCSDEAVANIPHALTSPRCTCAGDAYVSGGVDVLESTLSPYLYDDIHGCLFPVRATALAHVAEQELAISLTKGQTSAESRRLNLTLHLVGTDWRNGSSYSWVLRDPSPASWLQIERTHGTVTASQSASDVSTNLGVDIQSAGLRDASQSTASIQFDFTLSASVQGRSHPAQQLSFSITLYVSAMATASSFERSFAPVYLNEQMSLKFVARDVRQRNCSKPHLSSDDTVSPAPSGHSKPYLAHSLL
jgi:hypothetical protein